MTDHSTRPAFPAALTSSARTSSAFDTLFPDAARSIGLRRAGDIYRDALPGKRRRKNTAHHPLRHEPAVRKWLRMNQLELFTPLADCALASIQEQPGWSRGRRPILRVRPRCQATKWFDSCASTPTSGNRSRRLVNLPYVDREVDAVAAVRVPIEPSPSGCRR